MTKIRDGTGQNVRQTKTKSFVSTIAAGREHDHVNRGDACLDGS